MPGGAPRPPIPLTVRLCNNGRFFITGPNIMGFWGGGECKACFFSTLPSATCLLFWRASLLSTEIAETIGANRSVAHACARYFPRVFPTGLEVQACFRAHGYFHFHLAFGCLLRTQRFLGDNPACGPGLETGTVFKPHAPLLL